MPLIDITISGLNRAIFSSIITILIFAAIFFVLDRYDQTFPLYKLACFLLLLSLLPKDRKDLVPYPTSSKSNKFEIFILLAIAVAAVFHSVLPVLISINNPILSDMSQEVTLAVHRFFRFCANPYEYQGQVPSGFVANYRYGPLLLFGYSAAVLHLTKGAIFANMLLLAFVILLIVIVHLAILQKHVYSRATSALFSLVVILIPARFWFELFQRGAADLFDPLIFCLSLLFIEKKHWKALGVCAGVLLSSKIALGIALTVASLRKGVIRDFFIGLIIGLLPLLFFILWNPNAYYQSFILHQVEKGFDRTSLYSLLSNTYHPIVSIFPWIFAGIIIQKLFKTPATVASVLITSVKVLIVFEICYRHVHGNHLVWFVPPLAIALSLSRHSLLSRTFPEQWGMMRNASQRR